MIQFEYSRCNMISTLKFWIAFTSFWITFSLSGTLSGQDHCHCREVPSLKKAVLNNYYYFNFIDCEYDSLIRLNDLTELMPVSIEKRRDSTQTLNVFWINSENGEIVQKGTFSNNEPDGQFITYSGRDSSFGRFTDGIKQGVQEVVDNTTRTIEVYKNGCLDNFRRVFDRKSDKLIHITRYKNGYKHGVEIAFHKYSKESMNTLHYAESYNWGKMSDGPYRVYHPNGELFVEGEIQDGEYHGTFLIYDSKGNLIEIEKYREGDLMFSKEIPYQ